MAWNISNISLFPALSKCQVAEPEQYMYYARAQEGASFSNQSWGGGGMLLETGMNILGLLIYVVLVKDTCCILCGALMLLPPSDHLENHIRRAVGICRKKPTETCHRGEAKHGGSYACYIAMLVDGVFGCRKTNRQTSQNGNHDGSSGFPWTETIDETGRLILILHVSNNFQWIEIYISI